MKSKPPQSWEEYWRRQIAYEQECDRRNRPKIVCLCGSTRFYNEYQQVNFEETMDGKIVLSVGVFGSSLHKRHVKISPEDKAKLDELHKRKIDMADEILIINVNGYIGESTRREIEYAEKLNKPIRYRY